MSESNKLSSCQINFDGFLIVLICCYKGLKCHDCHCWVLLLIKQMGVLVGTRYCRSSRRTWRSIIHLSMESTQKTLQSLKHCRMLSTPNIFSMKSFLTSLCSPKGSQGCWGHLNSNNLNARKICKEAIFKFIRINRNCEEDHFYAFQTELSTAACTYLAAARRSI